MAFKEHSDPIKDLDIGVLQIPWNTEKYDVFNMIAQHIATLDIDIIKKIAKLIKSNPERLYFGDHCYTELSSREQLIIEYAVNSEIEYQNVLMGATVGGYSHIKSEDLKKYDAGLRTPFK